jgi:hypothetical protein
MDEVQEPSNSGCHAPSSEPYKSYILDHQADRKKNSWIEVLRTEAATETHRFTNVDFADMHFMHGFCDCNSLAALKRYEYRYPHWKKGFWNGVV